MGDATRRHERAGQIDDPAEGLRAHRRLQHLYEVSKLLTRFESVERTLPKVLAVVSESVPLCFACLILEEEGAQLRTRVITWRAEGVSAVRFQAAKALGESAYVKLVHRDARTHFEEEVGGGAPFGESANPPSAGGRTDGFVLLPLVVGHGRIFGAVQVQGAAALDETDLVFVNAVVNQLANALDRAAAVQARQAEAEAGRTAAERSAVVAMRYGETQRFLSKTSEILSSSLDLRTTLAAVARAAVPLVGDLCVIDEVGEDGQVYRREVVIADPTKQRLADRIRQFAPALGWNTPAARVLRSRKAVLIADVLGDTTIARDSAHAELLNEMGVRSSMSVPLVARGQTLGVLSFAACESGRRYSGRDLALAEDVGRRAAVAIDNARLYAQAQREIQARQDLLAIVSHELRNPLASISSALSILNLAPRDLRVCEQARGTMERQLAQMVRLVDDLLDVSRITGGKLELRLERVDLTSVVRQTAETCRAAMQSKGHDFVLELPEAPVYVHGDAVRLVQIFSNLLTNACKFTDRGGHIRMTAAVRGDEAVVSVADDGIGIPPAMLDRIFDMFTQVDAGLNRTHGGLGIGLTLVRSLAEMHGGSVVARSAGEGRGSEFVVSLPVSGPPEQDAAHSTLDPPAATARRVLVVDDDRDGAESLARLLRMSGHETFVACDGLSAVAIAEESRPDVVLLDIGLPKLNGYEAARRIRAAPWGAGMLLVAMTGRSQDEDRRKSMEAGFDRHLLKPMDTVVLMKLLSELPRAAR